MSSCLVDLSWPRVKICLLCSYMLSQDARKRTHSTGITKLKQSVKLLWCSVLIRVWYICIPYYSFRWLLIHWSLTDVEVTLKVLYPDAFYKSVSFAFHVISLVPQYRGDDKSTLVQVIAWCHQASSHCLGRCWHRCISPHGDEFNLQPRAKDQMLWTPY